MFVVVVVVVPKTNTRRSIPTKFSNCFRITLNIWLGGIYVY
jgi:hypothetical protein